MQTIRKTPAGRTILTSDGCSDYYDGALVQGAIICRISFPANIPFSTLEDGTLVGEFQGIKTTATRLAKLALYGDIPGTRVYEFRTVE